MRYNILSEIQTRYRSNRFSEYGGRWNYIRFDPRIKEDLELARLKESEVDRHEHMHQILNSAVQ